jgi:hypothetical protein
MTFYIKFYKKEFINHHDGTHTQKIERLWLEVKEMKRKRRGLRIDHLEDYIQEFIWRRNLLRHAKNKFYEVVRIVGHLTNC